jgi:Spy/CpxP family protein refolding chaperone
MKEMTRGKALVYLVAVFVAGLAAGGVGGFALGKHPAGPPPGPTKMTEQILAGLKAELKLNEEQVRQIRPLVEGTGKEIGAVREEVGARIGAIIKEGNRRMEAFLTAEQKQKLAEMEKQREQRFRKHDKPEHKSH